VENIVRQRPGQGQGEKERNVAHHTLDPEDGSSRLFRNIGELIPDYRASYFRR
jgi:hypothetical protein